MSPLNEKSYPEVLTIEQTAEYLQLHPQVVYRHVRAGTLPASRIGRTIRFKKSVLDAFLEKDAWASVGKFLSFVESEKSGKRTSSPALAATVPAPREEASKRARAGRFSVDVD